MPKKKEKLDFDLSFLDKEVAKDDLPSTEKEEKTDSSSSSSIQWNWKAIGAIVFSLVLIFIAIGSSEGDSTSSNSNPSYDSSATGDSLEESNNLYGVGEYWCSSYHYNKAGELEPSSYEAARVQRLENEFTTLSYEVNEYSPQYRIDEYNSKLAEYNSAVDSYNRKVETYNNYLINNCSKSKY